METNKTVILHNPRCSKSREAFNLLTDKDESFEVCDYLNGITVDYLKEIVGLLGIKPFDLLRKKEEIYISNYKGKDFSDDEWIQIMVENPKLIERPIVIKDGKAAIGRPLEKIIEIL